MFYWSAWCLVLTLLVLAPEQLANVWRDVWPRLGEPAWLGAACLILPLLLGYGYAFRRAVKEVSGSVVALSAAIALVNGMAEELFWRGAYVTLFPDSWLWGLVYPSVGFAIWHLAPQIVFPNRAPGGRTSLIITAGLVGLMWGWVAWSTGSILWVTVSHVLFDFSGWGGWVYLGGVE